MRSIDEAAAESLPPQLRDCLCHMERFGRHAGLNLTVSDSRIAFFRGKSANQFLISVGLDYEDAGASGTPLGYHVTLHDRKARREGNALADMLTGLYYSQGMQVSHTGAYPRR